MAKSLDYITVNYKNMEKVVVKREHILTLDMEGMTTMSGGFGSMLDKCRTEAEHITIDVKKFKDEDATKKSVIYSGVSPYERLTQDKTVESITLNYQDDTSEEIYVPYKSENPEVLGDNELATVEETRIERDYFPTEYGVAMKFSIGE